MSLVFVLSSHDVELLEGIFVTWSNFRHEHVLGLSRFSTMQLVRTQDTFMPHPLKPQEILFH